MAYQITMYPFLIFTGTILVLALVLRLFHRGATTSSRLFGGAIGSVIGFLLTPLLAAACHVIPTIMIDSLYFREPFVGCIAPAAFGKTILISALGVICGFALGCWLAPKRRGPRAA